MGRRCEAWVRSRILLMDGFHPFENRREFAARVRGKFEARARVGRAPGEPRRIEERGDASRFLYYTTVQLRELPKPKGEAADPAAPAAIWRAIQP